MAHGCPSALANGPAQLRRARSWLEGFGEGGEGLPGGEAMRYPSAAGQELMLPRQILAVEFI